MTAEFPSPTPAPRIDSTIHSDSTPTNSSDEFDWDGEGEDSPQTTDLKKAKRVRRLWLLYSRLSGGIRLLLVGVLGTAIILSPYIVFKLRFSHSVVYEQVATWSIWLAISYAGVSAFTWCLADRQIPYPSKLGNSNWFHRWVYPSYNHVDYVGVLG